MSSPTKNIRDSLANKLAGIAIQQIETAVRFKQARMDEIKMNEDLYHGKSLPRLRGRFNVPLPVMGGFVDTLLSKIDDPPAINYSSDDAADYKEVKKATAVVQKELKRRELRWKMKDINQKKMACFSGIGIGEFFAESDPKYKNYYSIIDYYDFLNEPMGGCDLENHSFCGRMNLFKSQHDLETGAKEGYYEREQIKKLVDAIGKNDRKRNEEVFKNKIHRFQLMGMDTENYNYLGQAVYPLVWWGMEYKGERYLLTLDYQTGVWVRAIKLKDDFESGLWPWTFWQTHPDEFVSWSKAPCDDMRPVAVAIDIIFNQALDNRQKRNFGQRAYDPTIFPNPEDLKWQPDGLVRATSSLGIKQIANGIYEFQTPEVGGTIDMINFMDTFAGRKTGITEAAQGETEEKRVGIFFGELQQVADRIGLYNKSYSDYHANLGLRMLWGMKEHLDEDMAVRLVGIKGVEMETLLRDKINPEWDIDVEGGQAKARDNDIKKQLRGQSLEKILAKPFLATKLNPEKAVRELLLNGEWTEEEVNQFLDLTDSTNAELISDAEVAIQKILEGEEPKLNRGATPAFIKHIVDYATNNNFSEDPDEDIALHSKIIDYAEQHLDIAAQNMARKGIKDRMQLMMNQIRSGGGGEGESITPARAGESTPGGPEPIPPARELATEMAGNAKAGIPPQ